MVKPKCFKTFNTDKLIHEIGVYQTELEHQSKKLQRTQQELEKIKGDYQELYEFAPIGFITLDKNNVIVNVNLTGAHLLGTPRSGLLNKRFSHFIAAGYQSVFHVHCQSVFSTKIKQTCELELLRKNDSSFYARLESIVVLNNIFNKPQLKIAFTDISNYRQTEQALQVAEEKIHSIVETTKEWIWNIDLQGRYLYSNSAVEFILGYKPKEIINRNHLLLMHKEDRQQFINMLPRLIRHKQGWNDLKIRWRHKDGTYRYLESTAVPLLDIHGKLCGFRGSDHDITLRKQAEEQIHQHHMALDQAAKMSSLGELASSLAHELTQPLTAINNFITGCVKRLESNSNQTHHLLAALQQAAQQAEHAGQIIHRMKDFARQGKLYLEKVDINKLIEEALISIRKEFPNTNVKIDFKSKDCPCHITADKIQLELVLLNLLRNGIEAMTNGNISQPELLIYSTKSVLNYVSVNIIDNGPGFKLTDVDKIFEACFTTKPRGLGMGLAICRTIIEAHGGKLIAQPDRLNKGAHFQFTLPINRKHGN